MKKRLSLIAIAFALLAAGVTSAAADKAGAPAPCALDVTGTWHLIVVLSEGGGDPVFTFKQDGEKLTGRHQGAFGEADVTGTIKGNEIMFPFKIGDPAEPVSYSGAVDGAAMKGKVPFGSYGGGTFTGTKAAKKQSRRRTLPRGVPDDGRVTAVRGIAAGRHARWRLWN